ncbi:MAG: M61 family metallopeptidase [Vicinamibacterales bacterium]
MTTRRREILAAPALAILLALAASPASVDAQDRAPITYRVRVPQPDTQYAHVEAVVPTGGRATVELMMPVWSPGYYRVEDYAARVDNVAAHGPGGEPLAIEKSRSNRWQVTTGGHASIRLTYRLLCDQRTVTTNEVTKEYGVFNGAAAFITLVETGRRPHEVQFDLPAGWTRVMTGLEVVPGEGAPRFRAADYETLVDSPILAGKLGVRAFTVAGTPHSVVSAGDTAGWDGDAATKALETYVQETHRFWGFLPYERYLFLLVFREGGGGLEHKNSTLCTVAARPGPGPWPSLGLLAHEHFHLYNAKRLRPVELGPFDFEKPPTTGALWIAEGVTSYYSTLLMTRAGMRTVPEYLASLSSLISTLENAPGRRLQSVEQSSLEVWNNSNSGVNPSASTVSYYNKGNVMGLLLDARIRRATGGRASLDDVMRLAFRRYSGERGYTADEFRQTAEEVAGVDLGEWFKRAVSSTEDLDYEDLLEWFGLRFTTGEGITGRWKLELRPDATDEQRARVRAWLQP